MHNSKRNGNRNLLAVPPNRQYFRNMRRYQNKRSMINNDNKTRWEPSCRFLVGICCTIFIIIVMFYMKSIANSYTHQYQYWYSPESITEHLHSNQSINKINYEIFQKWINKYPEIAAHRAHKGFTCDLWQCNPTYNPISNTWIEPRLEYKVLTNQDSYNQWNERHRQQNKGFLDPKQQCEWIFIGDSITFSWNYHLEIFNKYFNTNNNAHIYAESGDKIHEIGWRLNINQGNGYKYMKQCLLNNNKQKSLILLIGTNDIGAGNTYNVALKDYIVLLNEILNFLNDINHISKQKVVLYLIGVFPRGDTYISFNERSKNGNQDIKNEIWNVDNKYFYSINFMNDYLKTFANKHNDIVKFIDCNDYLLANNDKNIIEFKDNDGMIHEYQTGLMTMDIQEDMLHLTGKGYELWSHCILSSVSNIN